MVQKSTGFIIVQVVNGVRRQIPEARRKWEQKSENAEEGTEVAKSFFFFTHPQNESQRNRASSVWTRGEARKLGPSSRRVQRSTLQVTEHVFGQWWHWIIMIKDWDLSHGMYDLDGC